MKSFPLLSIFSYFIGVMLIRMIAPWWTIIIWCVLVAVIYRLKYTKGLSVFFHAFLGIGLWYVVMILYVDIPNAHLLSSRMAGLFFLPNYWLFIIINCVLGGLLGGLSAVAGWRGFQLIKWLYFNWSKS